MLVVRADSGLRLVLNDGASMRAENVVVAAGIGAFAHYPAAFAGLPRAVVSHTSDPVNRDLGRFSGKRVIVVGAGQSAVELAALLHEEGADVEVLVRRHQVRWINTSRLAESRMASRFYPFKAPGRIGFIGVNWLVEHPCLFTLFPRRSQNWMGGRAMLPRASAWLRPRTLKVTFTCGKQIVSAKERCGRVHPLFDDGTGRDADHILLGTGYKVDLAKYGFVNGNSARCPDDKRISGP